MSGGQADCASAQSFVENLPESSVVAAEPEVFVFSQAPEVGAMDGGVGFGGLVRFRARRQRNGLGARGSCSGTG